MELWIRSQCKRNLMKVEDIVAIDGYIEVYKCNDESTRVAEYKTQERALEVLDEIQSIINNDGVENEEYDKISGCYYATKKNVYEMPKE